MKQLPNFYSILPANARYCNDLSPNEKIFYAEVSALTNSYGHCNAKNKYFCELYGVDRRTISRWIKKLERLNFINVVYENGERKIYLKFSSQLQNVDNTVGTSLFLDLDATKMSQVWDKNVPLEFINNIYKKIDSLNHNIYLDAEHRQKVNDIINEIVERMRKKYPGYAEGISVKRKEGIILRLIIGVLAKAYFDPGLIGIRLGGKYIRHQDIVDLIDIFDISKCHGLVTFLVERDCEVNNLKMYIMASLFNAFEKQLENLKKQRKREQEEIEYLTDRAIKQEKQLALKKALHKDQGKKQDDQKESKLAEKMSVQEMFECVVHQSS